MLVCMDSCISIYILARDPQILLHLQKVNEAFIKRYRLAGAFARNAIFLHHLFGVRHTSHTIYSIHLYVIYVYISIAIEDIKYF